MKFVLLQSSNTQRVTATINNQDNTVILNKEYRRSSKELWKVGKGIKLSFESVLRLSDLLNSSDEETIYNLISQNFCELLEEET